MPGGSDSLANFTTGGGSLCLCGHRPTARAERLASTRQVRAEQVILLRAHVHYKARWAERLCS